MRIAVIGASITDLSAAEAFGVNWILTGFPGHGFKVGPQTADALAGVTAGCLAAGGFQGWISGRPGAMEDTAPPA